MTSINLHTDCYKRLLKKRNEENLKLAVIINNSLLDYITILKSREPYLKNYEYGYTLASFIPNEEILEEIEPYFSKGDKKLFTGLSEFYRFFDLIHQLDLMNVKDEKKMIEISEEKIINEVIEYFEKKGKYLLKSEREHIKALVNDSVKQMNEKQQEFEYKLKELGHRQLYI